MSKPPKSTGDSSSKPLSESTHMTLKKARRFFGIVFFISLVIFVLSVWLFPVIPPPTQARYQVEPPPPPPPSQAQILLEYSAPITLCGSAITALTTFFGFISTTFLLWRKERREQKDAGAKLLQTELDIEAKRLELEKERLELEKLRKEQGALK